MTRGRILQRLLLGFLLLSPLPLAGLAWWSSSAFERTLDRTVLANLSSLADKKADQINAYVEQRIEDGQSLGKSPTTQHALSILPSLLAGVETAQYQIDERRYRDYFSSVFDRGGDYDLLLTAADGTVVFSVLHEQDFATNLNSGPFRDSILAQAHRQALALLETQVTPLRAYAPSGGRPSVFVVSPVVRDGRALGTVALQLSLERLTQVTTDATGLGETGETVITQQEGDQVRYVTPRRGEPDAAFRLRVPINRLGLPMQAAIRGERGSGISTDSRGAEVVAAWRYLPALRWFMVVKMNSSEALAPALALRQHSLIALAVLMLAAFLVALVFARSIVRPVQALTAATRRIAAGGLQERAPLVGSVEFRELGESFNRMADRLSDEQARLEQRVAERTEALAASNRRFDDMVRRVPVGVYVFRFGADGNMRFDYVSPRVCELLGTTEAEVLRDATLAFARVHRDDIGDFVRFNTQAAQTCEPFRVETRFVLDGQIRWYRIESDGVALAEGGSVWNGVITDITDRKRDELALQQAADEQDTIFETATIGICLLRHRVILKCNRRLEEMLGYRHDELIGQTTRLWYTDEAAFVAGASIYAELAAGGIHRRDETLQRKDGSRFVCMLTGRAVDPGDLSRGTVWLLDDVTQERQAAAEMADARRAAEAANRAKSEFLANMSHEIRTPMNAVLGLTQLVLDGELAREQREFLETVMASARALLGVLNDVLDYSKIEAGRMEVERVAMSVDDVLCGVADLFAARLREKQLVLKREVGDAIPARVVGDPLRLTQVLNNLVGNAIKFTDHGEIAIRVDPVARDGDALLLRFTVRDTGIGLSPEQAARLFQPFSQADSSVTRKYGGTGLGLAISRRLVALMGGEIGVSSEAGKGATFSFTVRVHRLAPQADVAGSVAVPAAPVSPPAPPRRYPQLRVLLVEDNAQNRQVETGLLARRGVAVTAAAHGREALEQVARERFDLILMDVHMPVMGGLEATRRIRELPNGAAVPVVAMSAAVMRRDRERCAAAGMGDFLAKPIEPDALDAVLARWFVGTTEALVPAAADAAAQAEAPTLTGFELAAALRRLDGDAARLGQLLRSFADEHEGSAGELDAALQQGDTPGAIAGLHAIRGAAASLGARALAEVAAACETALSTGADAAGPRAVFADTLAATVSAIRGRYREDEGEASTAAHRLDDVAPALRDALCALRPYLERRELVPDTLHDTLGRFAGYDSIDGPLQRLLRQIDHFDQDGALATLAQLAAVLDREESA